MSYSRQEFFNQFKVFASQLDHFVEKNQIIILENNRQVRLFISENNSRQLGSLLLPNLTVKIEFQDYSLQQQNEFIDRFNQSFQRGGG